MKKKLYLILAASVLAAGIAQAALILTIDEFTNTGLTLTLGGTFDADSVGVATGLPGYIAIKANFATTKGVAFNWFGSDVALDSGSILKNGTAINAVQIMNSSDQSDSMYTWNTPGSYTSFKAGDALSGTLVFSGTFDTSVVNSIDLISGIDKTSGNAWNRLEATSVIPEPSVLALVGVFGAGVFGIRRFFLI